MDIFMLLYVPGAYGRIGVRATTCIPGSALTSEGRDESVSPLYTNTNQPCMKIKIYLAPIHVHINSWTVAIKGMHTMDTHRLLIMQAAA